MRYRVIAHPDIKGAWTITPYHGGTRLVFVSKPMAEAIATQRNNLMRAEEGRRILGK